MNKLLSTFFALAVLGQIHSQTTEKDNIGSVLDKWHKAASEANFGGYFELLSQDAVFIGTDASEVWNKSEFMAFSKPYFEQGKAWDFKAIQRNIYVDSSGSIAWFDELLDTWMQLCRGSGVMKLAGGEWKITHYVLSLTIPNEEINPVIELKRVKDSSFVRTIKEQN
jgi:ketosteroid isomerase-like protein